MKRIPLIFIGLLLAACSTTKLLPDGAYRLAENKVVFSGKEKISAGEIKPYIIQPANSTFIFGWSPGVNIYNWSNGSGKGINKFWEKAGEEPVVFDSTLVARSQENIANHLQSLGYFGSQVDASVNLKDRLARVTYTVTPGKRYPIDSLVFEVPAGEFEREFRADSANISVRVGDFLSEKSLEAESVRSASALHNRGYYDLSKNHYSFEADTLTDKTVLFYRVREYTRGDTPSNAVPLRKYHIGDVRISHPKEVPFRESLLRQYNTVRPGQLYSERLVNLAYSRFSALRLFNNVSVGMTPVDSTTVDCDIRLGGTNVVGIKLNLEASTNSAGLVGFSPQVNFYHKNIFHGGEWLNLGFSGNWQWLIGHGAASTELSVTAGLTFPRLLGFKVERMWGPNIPRTEINASFSYRDRPEYKRTLSSLKYGFSGQLGRNLFYQFYPFRLDYVKLFDASDEFYEILLRYPFIWDTFDSHIDAGVGGTLYYTTNSDVVPKTPYHYVRLALDVSGNVLSLFNNLMAKQSDEFTGEQRLLFGVPYKQYARLSVDMGKVFRFGWNDAQALALHLTGGIGVAYGNSLALPFEKSFFVGGASSMRGWQARTLGPGYEPLSTFFEIPSQTGSIKLEADAEYRFPMFWKLEGALFAEVGNVWEYSDYGDSAKFNLHSLAADWGLGVRVNLDFLLLRLDAGFRLRDPARAAGDMWVGPRAWFKEGAMAVHFGVGYPF